METKTITKELNFIILNYIESDRSSAGIHLAEFDSETHQFSDTKHLDGYSGSVIYKDCGGGDLCWAGMAITAGGSKLRYIQSSLIDDFLVRIDKED